MTAFNGVMCNCFTFAKFKLRRIFWNGLSKHAFLLLMFAFKTIAPMGRR